jgi:hypothetical protein
MTDLPAPEQWVLTKMSEAEVAEMIEKYIDFVDKSGRSVRLPQAAHIYPYRGPDTNKVPNGLLLRADWHTLFDCGLVTVDPSTMAIVVTCALRGSEYGAFHGRPLGVPRRAVDQPSKEALALHRKLAGI